MIRVIVLIILDLLAIPLLFLVSYAIKFKAGLLYNIIFNTNSGLIYNHAQIEPYFDNIGIIMIVWIISLLVMRSYDVYSGVLAFVDQIIAIVKAVLLATLLLMAISIITELMPNSLFVLGYNCLFGVIVFSCIRIWVDNVIKIKPFKQKPCCIIGGGKEAQYILEYILDQKKLYMNYVGSIYDKKPDEILFSVKDKQKQVAKFADAETYITKHNIKRLFLMKAEYSKKNIKSLIKVCENNNIDLHIYDHEIQTLKQKSRYNQLAGLNMLSYEVRNITKKEIILKRLFDCVIAYSLCICLLPVLALIGIWIKLVSPKGPIIFKQERVGINNTKFIMYKFRTMKPQAEKKSGPVWVSENDNRYIRGGRLLRKFSLDELPQLINIIKNDMSLVGPRPERPFFVDEITRTLPDFKLRHDIKGGVTGWAQIHGRAYLTTRPEEKLRYDLYYIQNSDFLFDIKIILKTILVVGKGEQAY